MNSIPTIGQGMLELALLMGVFQGMCASLGVWRKSPLFFRLTALTPYFQFGLLSLAFLTLFFAFLTNDFSVIYVAEHSNRLLPIRYRLSAVWGGHEGSMLLWVWILGAWTVAFAVKSRELPLDFQGRVFGVLGFLSALFLWFIVGTSNPFASYEGGIPLDGGELNPLLQDIGLILHPPLLYLGYVGFSIPFAFAVAVLWKGDATLLWAKALRPFVLLPWSFLTVGVALGSWWAYYELGWGGWWFWDPVENASLLPWLVGIGLVHSLWMTERRNQLQAWTVLLSIFTFAMSLLGTFLVRSGVLTSVHAFASDPERGIFILALFGVTVGGGLWLYAARGRLLARLSMEFHFFSKEGFMLLNTVLGVMAAALVLLGTLYPIILEAFDLGKISVGPPYFNKVFTPVVILLLFSMGIGVLLRSISEPFMPFAKKHGAGFVASVCAAFLITYFLAPSFKWLVWSMISLSAWVVWSVLFKYWEKVQRAGGVWKGTLKLSPRFFGMVLAHLGFAMAMLGAVWVIAYEVEHDLSMKIGERQQVGSLRIELKDIRTITGPNYMAIQGVLDVTKPNHEEVILMPEKRFYKSQANSAMTEAAIHPGFFYDIYISLGEPIGEGAWAVRIQTKPLVRWIWLGAILILAGGVLALFSRRRI
ncbi:MAG: heme lyase CcmF/NrfE family subunit [Gammaproteobacteria bacterium]|nr:heme lyase CcmF/NrfE family subunit [Gammaproteobacteria bacterium]